MKKKDEEEEISKKRKEILHIKERLCVLVTLLFFTLKFYIVKVWHLFEDIWN